MFRDFKFRNYFYVSVPEYSVNYSLSWCLQIDYSFSEYYVFILRLSPVLNDPDSQSEKPNVFPFGNTSRPRAHAHTPFTRGYNV